MAALIQLAADVKAMLGPATKVIYAADWSEYFGHQPGDGTGDVYFHLDPLWASAAIDAIGIDLYWPLADWRDGRAHLDYLAGARSTYDLAYLRGNVHGGEGYDWYYASAADRDAQMRSPITDGAGKPWVFRYKDIKSWWSEPALTTAPAASKPTTPTAWVPQSKPFWLMEIGCPAVDKGANQPNVFVDPKSAESALPYFSRGTSRRPDPAALSAGVDRRRSIPRIPAMSRTPIRCRRVYGGRMVDLARIHVYAWDARPFPGLSLTTSRSGATARTGGSGHWLNGRSASAPLAALVGQILDDYGFAAHDARRLDGTVPGLSIDRIMSARDALQPLELAYFFDALESGGRIVFRHRGGASRRCATLTVSTISSSAGGRTRC